jgi:hypothetical protein
MSMLTHETPADDDEDNHDDSPTSPSAVVSPAALQPHGGSPLLTISRPPERAPTAASGDVLLPLIICAVVRAAPPRLVAQLLVQRFRSRAAGGEAEYCLVNKMAVDEFLENVDLVVLGLTGPEGQIAECVVRPLACALTVLMCVRSSVSAGLDPGAPPLSPPPAGRPGHVEQQVNALTWTAQKVLTGVGAGGTHGERGGGRGPVERGAAHVRAPRREPGFAIASLAASLPGRPAPSRAEELGGQMMEVASRPASRASSLYELIEEESEEEDEDGGENGTAPEDPIGGDLHSVRSMLRSRRKAVSHKSLADRLARVSGVCAALDTRRVRPPPFAPISRADSPASRPRGACRYSRTTR